MAIYDTSFMGSVTNVVDIMIGIGTQVGMPYLVGDMILFGFFTIFLLAAFRYNFVEVMIIDSFLTTLIAILIYIPGLIAASHIPIPAVMFFISVIIYFFVNR